MMESSEEKGEPILVVAVSGGVDSMVLLDMLIEKYGTEEMVVAHFDHGMRERSGEDLEFVRQKCEEYGVGLVSERAQLPEDASEETARMARYEFFFNVIQDIFERRLNEGRRLRGPIHLVTAHHLDDLVETCAINFLRGTGWRGLTGMTGFAGRPFLDGEFGRVLDRRDVLREAARRNLSFRWDNTNGEKKYLRNRVRPLVMEMEREEKEKILKLWRRQVAIRQEVDETTREWVGEHMWERGESFPREWFQVDTRVAMEILRTIEEYWVLRLTGKQRRDFLRAIREYLPGKRFNLPEGRMVRFSRDKFWLEGGVI